MRGLAILAFIVAGCGGSGGGGDLGADLAFNPDLSCAPTMEPLPCQSPQGGFCVAGLVYDFTSRMLLQSCDVHVAIYEAVSYLADPGGATPIAASDGASYSFAPTASPAQAVVVVEGVGLLPSVTSMNVAANDAYRLDTYAIPSSLASGGGTLALFYADFQPSLTDLRFPSLHPATGVTATLAGGTIAYVDDGNAMLSSTATATTSAGAALVGGSGMLSATGGTNCAGPCFWTAQTIAQAPSGVFVLTPFFQ